MPEEVPAALVSGLIAFLVAWFSSRWQIRNSIAEFTERQKLTEAAEQGKIAEKYTGVILLAAMDLQDRLWHLCVRQAKARSPLLLEEDAFKPKSSTWPMTKDHYLTSTVYLFARYFCWVAILRLELRFLNMGQEKKTNTFNYHLKRIERTLAETGLQALFPTKVSSDQPVFQLHQTEIGQSLIRDQSGRMECIKLLSVL